MNCVDTFRSLYRRDPDGTAFCPYRVCPIGAHSDHQHGKITGLAIDKGITIAYGAKQGGICELVSLSFDKRAQFHVAQVPEEKQGDWADYLRGAAIALKRKYTLTVGICGVIEGSLPIGGLSSSAAVTLSFLIALCRVNRICPTPEELIGFSRWAENRYVGIASGTLDQSCEIYAQKDHLLYLDTANGRYENIPAPKHMPAYRIAVFFSGVERTLVGSGFNCRVDECRSAAYALKAYAGIPYGKFEDTCLRDVPREVFESYKDRLPETFAHRAAHWYGEFERVEQGAEAWRRGDLATYGRLSFESGRSSIELWETGSEELKTLYLALCHTDGIYGGRFSGAGFKGCCMALVDPSLEESIVRSVTHTYLAAFPGLKDRFSVCFCQSANGVMNV